MVNLRKIAVLVALAPCLFACAPEFSERSSAVTAPRVLGIRSSPAEVLPGEDVSYQLLVGNVQGTVASPRADWSYCTQPKATNELNDVAPQCFGEGDFVIPFGTGTAPTGTLPVNACAQFGPDVPQPSSGSGSDSSGNAVTQTQGRPTDPDSTGGYYQPVILRVRTAGTEIPTLGETRITCGLAGSTGEQFEEYNQRTKTNENPQISTVIVPSLANAELTPEEAAEPLAVSAAQVLTLRVSWPACPTQPSCGDGICSPGEAIQDCPDDCTTPVGCGGSESFAYLDPESHVLVDRHESMRVSWFATGGSLYTDHTGRGQDEFTQTSSDNTWTAPEEPGPVFMWVVLRDDRGGVDWRSFKVIVQ
ncbi:MAG TPA: hypothetical protein VGC79_02770 [Polyangiaceae bacterium]